MVPFDKSHTSSYSSFVVIVVISCIVSDTEWDSGRKSGFLMPPSTQQSFPSGNQLRIFAYFYNWVRSVACQVVQIDCTQSCVYSQLKRVTNGQTDRRTEMRSQ